MMQHFDRAATWSYFYCMQRIAEATPEQDTVVLHCPELERWAIENL